MASTHTPNTRKTRNHARPRTLVACVNCKDRKLKCDDQVPACANCQRFDLVCLVDDPVTKQRRPRNYLESLEERVALLESILQQVQPDLAQDHLFPGGFHNTNRQCTPPASTPLANDEVVDQQSISLARQEDEGLNDLASNVGMLSLNAAGVEAHYLGSSSGFAFSRVINSSLLKGMQMSSKTTSGSNQGSQSSQSPCLLPDHDGRVILSNAYFRNIHPQYPFLHEPTFRAWEMTLTMPGEIMSTLEPTALFFLYMVYAVGALLLPRSGYSPERLYTSAQLYINHVLPHDNLEAIQAILCCLMFSLRSPSNLSIWKLSGLALRQCIELGYHRNSKRFGPSISPLQVELRKRAFWCVYIIDCACAITLGRPLGIPDNEVDVEYSLDIDDSYITDTDSQICGTPRTSPNDPPTSMTVSIHAVRLRRLWARIHTSLYSASTLSSLTHPVYISRVEQLRVELDEWQATIPPMPPRLDESLSLFATEDWFEVNYSYTILLLYRNQLTENQRNGVSDEIFLECLRAAENICHRYRRQFVGRSVGYTWGALHFLFVAGLTYLHCLWTSPTVRELTRPDEVSSTCTDCIMVLVVMAERWEGATLYRDMFETLVGRTMTMMSNKHHNDLNLPGTTSMHVDDMDQDYFSQCVADIANTSLPNGVDSFLTSFVNNSFTWE